MPKIFWMKFCGLSDIWLQVLTGAVPSRKADVEGVAGAGGVGEEVGGLVDAGGGDAFGRGEGFDVGVLGELDGAVHELGPDGCGGVGALERCVSPREISV